MLKKIIIIALSIFSLFLLFYKTETVQAVTVIEDYTYISEDTAWTVEQSPYVIKRGLILDYGAVLTIEPGVIVKFGIASITVHSTLIANGRQDAKIIFTSIKDDFYGGDTNNDGTETFPQAGDWYGLDFTKNAVGRFDNVIVAYGGKFPGPSMISVDQNNYVSITNSEIRDSRSAGINLWSSRIVVENSRIINNGIGIVNKSGSLRSVIANNVIAGNLGHGAFTPGSGYWIDPIDARYNWWGDASGPSGTMKYPDALGDKISGKVFYEPWLTQEPEPIAESGRLIFQYEPILYFHPEEDFFPINVEYFVTLSSLWDSQGIEEDILLHEQNDYHMNLSKFADLSRGQDSSNWYLQFIEDLDNKVPDPAKTLLDYEMLVSRGHAPNVYFAHRMEDSYTDENNRRHNFIVLQYWYFYYMNDFGAKVEKGNIHEGDWETVMIFLDKETEQPKYVAYSAHHNEGQITDPLLQFDSVRRSWDSEEINKQDNQVISYVALGSHANYPNNGNQGRHEIQIFDEVGQFLFATHDLTSEDGLHYNSDDWYKIEVLYNEFLPGWLTEYAGRWGVLPQTFTNPIDRIYQRPGPRGPYYQDRSHQPIKWAGVDKVGQTTVWEEFVGVKKFTKQLAAILFYTAVQETAELVVDMHEEVINFGQTVQEQAELLPRFWDITSDLVNETFEAEVQLMYSLEELLHLGVDENNLAVFMYQPEQDIWQEVPSIVDKENKVVKFFTTHFSIYAIGAKPEVWQDITDKVKVQKTKSNFSKKTQEQTYKIRLKNEDKDKQEIKGGLRLVLENLPEGSEVLQSDGITQDNKPYLDFTDSYNWCRFAGEETEIPENLQGKGVAKKANRKKLVKKKLMKIKVCQVLEENNESLQGKFENVLPKGKKTKTRELKIKVPKKVKFKDLEWQVFNK